MALVSPASAGERPFRRGLLSRSQSGCGELRDRSAATLLCLRGLRGAQPASPVQSPLLCQPESGCGAFQHESVGALSEEGRIRGAQPSSRLRHKLLSRPLSRGTQERAEPADALHGTGRCTRSGPQSPVRCHRVFRAQSRCRPQGHQSAVAPSRTTRRPKPPWTRREIAPSASCGGGRIRRAGAWNARRPENHGTASEVAGRLRDVGPAAAGQRIRLHPASERRHPLLQLRLLSGGCHSVRDDGVLLSNGDSGGGRRLDRRRLDFHGRRVGRPLPLPPVASVQYGAGRRALQRHPQQPGQVHPVSRRRRHSGSRQDRSTGGHDDPRYRHRYCRLRVRAVRCRWNWPPDAGSLHPGWFRVHARGFPAPLGTRVLLADPLRAVPVRVAGPRAVPVHYQGGEGGLDLLGGPRFHIAALRIPPGRARDVPNPWPQHFHQPRRHGARLSAGMHVCASGRPE